MNGNKTDQQGPTQTGASREHGIADDHGVPTVQMLAPDGTFAPNEAAEEFVPFFERLGDDDFRQFYRDMVVVRRFDKDAANLQRQGQLALWVPSHGQEAAQVGSARAARPQDHIFPSYREHVVGMVRGLDPVNILRVLKGVTMGGWDPAENGNFHLYSFVLASQSLHATGYAMGMQFDGTTATGNPETDEAVMVYYGDGASSQGDVNEALVFASSYQTPQVFFLQNNGWAISVPVERQSRVPLALRGAGFGMPGTRIDGNDVFASYAVTAKHLDDARAGHGPALIEAMTYRVGAHTTADDPTKYRRDAETAAWAPRDPILRLHAFLQARGTEQAFFDDTDAEAADFASDARKRALEVVAPDTDVIFDNVYAEPHPLVTEQKAWLDNFEASFEDGSA